MGFWNSRQVPEELYSLQAKCHLSFREPQALKTHKPSADLSKKQSVSISYIQFRSGMGTRSWIFSYSTIACKFLLKWFQSFGHSKGLLAICLWKSHTDRTISATGKLLSLKESRVEFRSSRHNTWLHFLWKRPMEGITGKGRRWGGSRDGVSLMWAPQERGRILRRLTGWVWHPRISFLNRFWQHVHRMVI